MWGPGNRYQVWNGNIYSLYINTCIIIYKTIFLNRFKNGEEIRSKEHIKTSVTPDGVCTLSIKKSSTDDAGTYAIEITNESGSKRSQAEATVFGE